MRTNENIVSSFFYYMWNTFDKEEAIHIYGKNMGEHFYGKWDGNIETLYGEMTTDNREKLVNRALELYNGSKNIK